jgi:hypothetical protein
MGKAHADESRCKTLTGDEYMKWPKHYTYFHALAKGMSCPSGRALYACNRVANGDRKAPWDMVHDGKYWTPEQAQKFADQEVESNRAWMRTIHLDTAQRWLAHWKNDGSIRAISRTNEEQRAFRRKYDDRVRVQRRVWAQKARLSAE